MNPFIEVAISIRELLAPPGAWIQKYSALDTNYNWVDPEDEQAVKFCLLGAAQHALRFTSKSYRDNCLDELCAWFGVPDDVALTQLNDNPFMTQGVIVGRLNEIINALI